MTALASPPVLVTPSLPRQYTDEELAKLADDGVSEFVDGRVVEKDMNADATWTAARVGHYITISVIQAGAGDVFAEQSFRCVPNDPRGFRRPDVSFVAAGRVPTPAPGGPLPFAPDLAVEVVSPNDNVEELETKLAEYRAAGVRLVWVVIPAVRTVRVFPLDGPDHAVRAGDTLSGGDVLPGFAVPVADLFRPAAARP